MRAIEVLWPIASPVGHVAPLLGRIHHPRQVRADVLVPIAEFGVAVSLKIAARMGHREPDLRFCCLGIRVTELTDE